MVKEIKTINFRSANDRFVKALVGEEFDSHKISELIASCLDVFYCATDGNLWRGGTISSRLKDRVTGRVEGTVNFIPVPLAPLDGQEKVGVFVFSQERRLDRVVSSVGIKCDLTERGHSNLQATFVAVEYSTDFMFQGIAAFALSILERVTTTHD